MLKENIIYVGRKPVMTYVLVLIERLNRVKSGNIIIKARGRAISTAVDTVEVAKRFLGKDLEISVDIGTEELSQEDGGLRNVSAMEITIARAEEEGKVPDEKKEPALTGEPEKPEAVDESTPEEALEPTQDEEKVSEHKSDDETPEGDK